MDSMLQGNLGQGCLPEMQIKIVLPACQGEQASQHGGTRGNVVNSQAHNW